MRNRNLRTILIISVILIAVPFAAAFAQSLPIPFVDIRMKEAQSPKEVSLGLQVLFLLSILSLAPSIIIMVTSFLRVSIVLSFLQRALSLQETPPRAIIMGLSLFLTFFIMQPTINEMNTKALQPYLSGKIGVNEFFSQSEKPLRTFMLTTLNSRNGMSNLDLFIYLSKKGSLKDPASIPTSVVIPAFIINELTVAFKMGIWLFIPFIVIDLIVAAALMAMGMIMLPPVMISLPLKLILFIAVDGWKLISYQLVQSYR
ncbi:MAG: flagellar type III secretion system pore protein FliP [Spirochaetes bacterium]|nr:flagellar type III secretion system pore protein FliP [Spirochaetota bacterium]